MAETAKQMNIYQAISKCMEEIRAVGKDSLNKSQGFKYRGIDAVMNALNPALVRNHIFIVPEVLEQKREERETKSGTNLIYSVCKIKFTFYTADGTSIAAIVIGEGMDSGDKATNKAMAVAFKYACFQVFCIPTEEMADPDAESHEVKKESAADKDCKRQEVIQPEFVPATVEQLRKMNDFMSAYADICDEANINDICTLLKERYKYEHTSDISTGLADKIIKQLETWYRKKKGFDS